MTSSSTVACRHARDQMLRILVVRNDKLGDFMLAWPALACLKATVPAARISVLVPSYTAPLARLCPWVDEVIIDPGTGKAAKQALLDRLRRERFSAMLTLYSTPRIGWLGWRAGIPCRVAPATKWAQLFYNHRVIQRRSRSAKPEYLYNIELAEALLTALGHTLKPRPSPPFWPLKPDSIEAQREEIASELDLDASRPWLFLHAGSGGSAVNLSTAQYAKLAAAIDSRLTATGIQAHWVLTAGPGEEQTALSLSNTLSTAGLHAAVLPSRQRLEDFALALAAADLFIAGSTGPLHIAGCLNRPTAGFYPARRSATSLRWQTCNEEACRLAFSPPEGAGESEMSAIDLETAAATISDLVRRRAAETCAS
ncbi:glycosyltransferase family 9 protein [Billgrantia kenyensis]|uniref:Glycosyltransferase family 9 protein n=1 Tax=Billgrantia kenyensis TaxID=321266 RepID=A0A7V9VYP2_9GAMM|nr:glycosyltransferase family 9 protein [Halomonas kenyensis]MBA2777888.1 glycosyltransferase family 9 protein [Halomonas kenyensis]MCG6661359.1 glycosyltransferase family 9 protein [Halomonas kenyensis]